MNVSTSRKERDKKRRQQEILVAAKTVFLKKGYLGTTMDDIALEAEFSKGTLYSYFRSKYELFATLSTQVLEKTLQGFESIIADQETTGLEALRALLLHWADTVSLNIEIFRLAMGWVASNERADTKGPEGQYHQEKIAEFIAHLTTALERGCKDGTITREVQVVSLAWQLWSGMMGTLLFNSRNKELMEDFPIPNHVCNDVFVEDYVSLLLAGLSAP